MEIRLLGPLEVEDAGTVLPLPRPREQCLLGILALNAGRPVAAERLTRLLWEDEPPAGARAALHTYVSRLRAVLPATAPLRRVRSGYVLEVPPSRVDALRFRAAVRDLADVAEPGPRADGLRAALDLWRGPALAGVVTDWLRPRLLGELEELRLTATEDWLAAELARGGGDRLVPTLIRLTTEHPVRERLIDVAMRALAGTGRTADALALFRRARSAMVEELGIEPGAELQRLHRSLLAGSGEADGSSAAPAPTGERPSWMPRPRMLPRSVGHFVGREAELAELDAMLAGEDGLAVLTGPGGIGKTALAVYWGRLAAEHFPDGELFVDLRGAGEGPVTPPAVVLAMFLRALGLPPHQVPAGLAERSALYRSLLTARRMLVVLDNAAGVDQVRPLLPGTSSCAVLVTSRNRMPALAVESAVTAVELSLLAPAAGVELIGRMVGDAEVRRDHDGAAELVRLCGGLPLAVRVAAAKLAMQGGTGIGDLVAELADEHGRLDALATGDAAGAVGVRAAFAGSYQALPAATRHVFRLAGRHPRPEFTAESVAAMGAIPEPVARSAIEQLVDACLAHESAPDRYACHDLTWLYARECAENAEDVEDTEDADDGSAAEALERLLDRYVVVAASAWRQLCGEEPPVSPARFPRPDLALPDGQDEVFAWADREWDGMAAAIRLAAENGPARPAWQLAWLLSRVAHLRGFHRYLDVAAAGLAAVRGDGDRDGEARLLVRAGLASAAVHRVDEALDRLRRAVGWYERTGQQRELGAAWGGIGFTYYRRHDYPAAVRAYQRSIEHAERAGDQVGLGVMLNNLGSVGVETGDLDRARGWLTRALAVLRDAGSLQGEGLALLGLGQLEQVSGDHAAAVRLLTDCIAVYRVVGDRIGEAAAHTFLARAHLAMADTSTARTELAVVRELAEAMGDGHTIAACLTDLAMVELADGAVDAAATALAQAADLRRHLPDPMEEARLAQATGDLAAATGRPAEAADHWHRALDGYRLVGAAREADELTRRLSAGPRA